MHFPDSEREPLLSLPLGWASGVRDAVLDPVHPLLGTLSILGTEVVHTFAGLELQNQMKRMRWRAGCSKASGKYARPSL